jgi:hypothetical protein
MHYTNIDIAPVCATKKSHNLEVLQKCHFLKENALQYICSRLNSRGTRIRHNKKGNGYASEC